jgi:U3 small nucleolar RNA-associated protein 11
LREKASGRNKDEFYFGMIRGSTQKGVHVQKRGRAGEGGMDEELVRVLKSQDGGYLRVQKAVEEGVSLIRFGGMRGRS